jgi:hypothetical protein
MFVTEFEFLENAKGCKIDSLRCECALQVKVNCTLLTAPGHGESETVVVEEDVNWL